MISGFANSSRPAITSSFLIEQPTDVPGPASSGLGPVGIPVRAVRARRAAGLPTLHLALSQSNRGLRADGHTALLQTGAGEDEQPPKFWLVELANRIEQIAIEAHGSGDTGAGSRREQPRHVPTICEGPPHWRGQTIGVRRAQAVSGPEVGRTIELHQRHRAGVVVEGHHRSSGRRTANAHRHHRDGDGRRPARAVQGSRSQRRRRARPTTPSARQVRPSASDQNNTGTLSTFALANSSGDASHTSSTRPAT